MRPHPKLEHDLQQEVEGGRQQLTVVRTATDSHNHAARFASGASGTSFTFESSCEHFTTFVNDAELAILSILCYMYSVVMNTCYLHVKINNL